MTMVISQCLKCRWYLSGQKCKAFAEIPQDIYLNNADHTRPYPGDQGIQFEPLPADTEDD